MHHSVLLITNSNGPKTLSCGIPLVTSSGYEKTSIYAPQHGYKTLLTKVTAPRIVTFIRCL